ncbi:hypothetical protein Tco_1024595, partial [Tanacetum coccineum]
EMKNDVDITFIGSSSFDQEMKEADSELASMLDDEVMSISGNEDEKDDSDKELSIADEIEADKPLLHLRGDVQALIAKAIWEKKNIPQRTIPHVQSHSALQRFKAIQTTKSPRPLYKEFNSLNKLESHRFVTLEKKLRKSILCQASDEADQLHRTDPSLIYKVPRDILVVNAKHLQTKLDRTSNDIHELVELVTQLVRTIDSVAPPTNVATKGEKESQAKYDPAIEVPTSAQGE